MLHSVLVMLPHLSHEKTVREEYLIGEVRAVRDENDESKLNAVCAFAVCLCVKKKKKNPCLFECENRAGSPPHR